MSTTTFSRPALAAFKLAVADDLAGASRYPADALIVPAGIGLRALMEAVGDRDVRATTLVFIRADGAELVAAPRRPETFRERLLARLGLHPVDIEIRPANGDTRLYHDARLSRSARDLLKYERRAFARA